MGDSNSSRIIQSVQTATRLIGHIRESDGATITELVERTSMSPGAVHTQLATLKQANHVVQHGNEYRLGPELLTLGEHVRNRSELYQASKSQVEELAETTGESAHLIIEHNGRLFSLYEQFGTEAVGVEFHERKRERPLNHLHCTAAGKAILAELPEERTTRIFDEGRLPNITRHTITDRNKLLNELAEIRNQGFALNDQEQIEGIRAVGTSIVDLEGDVAGAIALSGPTSRLQDERFRKDLPQRVSQSANICEINLQSTDVLDG